MLVGANGTTVDFARRLLEKGLLIRAVRPPTVPVGTARVRLSLTLDMSEKTLPLAADMIAGAAREAGIIMSRGVFITGTDHSASARPWSLPVPGAVAGGGASTPCP